MNGVGKFIGGNINIGGNLKTNFTDTPSSTRKAAKAAQFIIRKIAHSRKRGSVQLLNIARGFKPRRSPEIEKEMFEYYPF